MHTVTSKDQSTSAGTAIIDPEVFQEAGDCRKVYNRGSPSINGALRDAAFKIGILSRQEVAVLVAAASGYEDKEIAEALHISYSTVRTIWSRLIGKMRVTSRRHAVARLLEAALDV